MATTTFTARPTARKCADRVPVDRCPRCAPLLAAAPVLVFDEDARAALDEVLGE